MSLAMLAMCGPLLPWDEVAKMCKHNEFKPQTYPAVRKDYWTIGLISAGIIHQSSCWWAATGIYECQAQ